MKKWLRNKMVNVMLALHWTESALKTNSDEVKLGEGKFQSINKGMLSDALINGEVTQEVKELRWRLYKILEHTDKLTSKIVGYDDEGMPIVETTKKVSPKHKLKKYKCDKSDDEFKLIMVVPNYNIEMATSEVVGGFSDEGEMSKDDYLSNVKNRKTILINRDHTPMFNIEDYTEKLLVREMNDERVLLEFYLHKYPNENKRSRFVVSELKKILNGKHRSAAIDFDEVFFISNKTLGVDNNLEFQFSIDKFHRIIEYEGFYVVKFVAQKTVFGDSIFEKYRLADLDEKYDKKAKK